MSQDPASQPKNVTDGQDVSALLKVSKGSSFIPAILTVIAGVLFMAVWLPPSKNLLLAEFDRYCDAVASKQSDKTAPTEVKPQQTTSGSATGAGAVGQNADGSAPPTGTDAVGSPTKPGDGSAQINGGTTKGVAGTLPKPPVAELTMEPKNYRAICVSTGNVVTERVRLREDFAKRNYWTETPLQSFKGDNLDGKDQQIASVVRLTLAVVKLFLEDLGKALAKHWATLLSGLATASLVALIPGVAGMIYRRAFWTWFTIAFAGLTAFWIIADRIGRSLTAEGSTADGLAAGLSVFFVAQAAVVLFTSRLRRHSASQPFFASVVPVGLYNRTVRYSLIGAGIGIVTGYIGAFKWSNWWHWNVVILGLPFIYYILKVNPSWSGKARKNIVVCLDGTSNTPDQFDMGLSAQTNVFKLFKMLQSDPNGSFAPTGRFDATLCKTFKDRQVGLYYTGIGNKFDADPLIGTLSQATGLGASGIIERAYLDIMRVWRPGDRLFIFGFSRGAASARILSRMIEKRGAPKSIWSLRLFGRHWTLWPSKSVNKVDIDVLGCWDTVGSFGISKTIAGINFQQLNLLHDLSVPENVLQAYHLVALDEDRQEFEPTLMDPDPMRPERIVEVWFAGGHAGVGGGWATDRLSDVALDFMLRRISSGYCFDGSTEPGDDRWGVLLSAVNVSDAAARAKAKPDAMQLFPDPLGELRTYFSNVYNYRPRKLPLHAVLSENIFERMTKSIPVYAPQALFDLSDALDAKRELVTNKVKTLEKIQSLDVIEREKIMEFAQKLRLTRFPHYWEDVDKRRKSKRPEAALSNQEERAGSAKLHRGLSRISA